MTIDTERPVAVQEDQRLVYREGMFSRFLRRNLPRGLFVRSLLIIIIPMVLLQLVVAAVFMERHWQMVTTRLSSAVTRDIAALIDLSSTPQSVSNIELARIAKDRMGMLITITAGDNLPPPRPIPLFSILDRTLSEQITQQINLPFWLNTSDDAKTVEIRIKIDNHRILSVVTRRDRAYASNTQIFLIWMAGTSLVLIIISILFLRGQIRPIEALTRAAELFGKGQKPTKAFVPRGADEVRRAGLAFLQMRERIERQIEQRTMMLSGVSHDLRTILTRFRLQLAVADSPADLEGLNSDVDDMNTMLDGYLDFARGQAEEQQGELDLYQLFLKLEASATLHGKVLVAAIEGNSTVTVRPNAFTRLVTNLTANAWRHAKSNIRIEARTTTRFLTIVIDDDGPGIPETMREEVFKPFYRLDEARNLDASGTGLGLAIVRDIARSHGGNVTLSDSPLGGLRATVRVPM